MTCTSQTQADLKSIIEILDQRIHELTEGGAERREAAALGELRDRAAGLLAPV